MGNKIKAGEYIRTKEGEIGVIGFPDEEENMFEQKQFEWYSNGKSYNLIKEYEIIKHSKNIIDLIEEGDYVNGNEIALEAPNPDPLCDPIYGYFDRYGELVGIIENEDIKSIVTKEKFKSVEYEV